MSNTIFQFHRLPPKNFSTLKAHIHVVVFFPLTILLRQIYRCDGKVLLLKRSLTSGNPGTWGLPGGNADPEDEGDLLVTARREASEELTTVPNFQVIDKLLTKRGKNDQKHYTVFLCSITPEEKAVWEPTIAMNEEHTAYKWVSTAEVTLISNAKELHPVVKKVFELPEHKATVLKAVGSTIA